MKTSANEFSKVFAKLCAAYPRFDATEATMQVYFERLCLYEAAKIAAAADKAIDNCEFFPSIAWLIESIKQLPAPKRGKLALDEPRPSAEQIRKNREILREMIKGIGK